MRHIFANGVYADDELRGALTGHGDWTIEIVKHSDAAKGFEVLPSRWVVESTFEWLSRTRRLAKDWENPLTAAILQIVALWVVLLQPACGLRLFVYLRLWYTRSWFRYILARMVGSGGLLVHRPRIPGTLFDLMFGAGVAVLISLYVVGPIDSWENDLALGFILIALAIFDLRWFWLPDAITKPLMAIGVLRAIVVDELSSALLSAIIVASVFFSIRIFYRKLRSLEALGMGDIKMMTAAALWLGAERACIAIVIAAVLAIIVVFSRAWWLAEHIMTKTRIPFGAFLAVGIWSAWLSAR